MIDYSNSTLDEVSAHKVGNKNNGEDLIISKHRLDISDKSVETLLHKYFLNQFKSEEYFNFTFSNEDFTMNPIYKYCKDVFEGMGDFHLNSINIAKHLYETSNHPNIKDGDLFVAFFSRLMVDYKEVKAIGIFKSESKQSFLKLDTSGKDFQMVSDEGMKLDKPDKGCLVIQDEEDKGYKVCIIDRTNRSEEALFWKDNFLMICPRKDEYHQTTDFLDIARQFVTKALPENFEVNKSDQIDLLNRSMEYFKTRDTFDKEEFEQEVFQDESVIESFKRFDQTYREENKIEMEDSFDINLSAVKKQNRVYKSILKLDRNFHIYIHGNKELIVPGVEKDGRKYYKIYYEQEN